MFNNYILNSVWHLADRFPVYRRMPPDPAAKLGTTLNIDKKIVLTNY